MYKRQGERRSSLSSTGSDDCFHSDNNIVLQSTVGSTLSAGVANTNYRFALDRSDSLISLNLPSISEYYESGGEDTGVFDRWTQKNIVCKKFVDDVSGCEKLHFNNIYFSKIHNDNETRFVHATQAQSLFDAVASGAASKGMRLNEEKTKLVCISAARSYKAVTFIKLKDDVIMSGPKLKLLGFHFDSSPSPAAHVKMILKKVRYRTWIIYHLKRLGMGPGALVNVYRSLIRPCFDYASVVYHPMLTAAQSSALERQQRKILKVIFGWDQSYYSALASSVLERLDVRRTGLVERFAIRLAANPLLESWLPLNERSQHSLRSTQKYKEFGFRTERLRRAPLYSFRRVLNFLESESLGGREG